MIFRSCIKIVNKDSENHSTNTILFSRKTIMCKIFEYLCDLFNVLMYMELSLIGLIIVLDILLKHLLLLIVEAVLICS